MNDHDKPQQFKIASRVPAKQQFSSGTVCYYKREVITCDLLAILHFASGAGLVKRIERAMTSGFGSRSVTPVLSLASCLAFGWEPNLVFLL